jgi:N-hydroxyarylamine O-acetyltransferase
MHAIPFENIDPLLGRVPSLALEDITAKLVTGRRGGYCFEHNALFGHVLTALGHTPRAVLARVFDPSGRSGARSHHAFTVEAEGETWLCDTGFGGHGALAPLRLTTPAPQAAPNGTYRVRVDAASGETALDRQAGEDWVPLYAFDRAPVRDIDFEAANFLCARWADAPFSANLMVAFHSDAGRLALFNRAVTRGMPPETEQAHLVSPDDLDELLRTGCGLDLAKPQVAQIWAKIETAPTRR